MLKFGHPKVAVVPLLGILFLGVGFLAATAAIGGVRINTSYSLPLGIYVRTPRNFSNQFTRGDPQMQEVLKDNHILTINDVAAILRCSKTHVSHVLAGKIPGIPRLTHIAMGRRKLVRRDWLDQWMESNKQQ